MVKITGKNILNVPAIAVVLVVGAVFDPQSSVAASFTNGSFETGGNPGAWLELPAGYTGITGWTVTSGNIDYVGTLWTAADGNRSLDLNGSRPGAISQTFDTAVGQRYDVAFDLAGNYSGGPSTHIKTLQVSAAGLNQQYQFDDTGRSSTDMGWMTEHFQFTATSTSTALTFLSLTTSGGFNGQQWFGPALDNVRVSAVPLPGALALFAPAVLGFLGMGWLRRR